MTIPTRSPDHVVSERSLVRSYDFDGRDDCYIEGYVIGHDHYEGCRRYKIYVERRVIGGKETKVYKPWIVMPPVNGTPMGFSITGKDRTDFVVTVTGPDE